MSSSDKEKTPTPSEDGDGLADPVAEKQVEAGFRERQEGKETASLDVQELQTDDDKARPRQQDGSVEPLPNPDALNAGLALPADNIATEPLQLVESEAPPQYVTGIKLWLIVLALALTLLVTMLDMSIISTAIPHITNEFHSLQDVGWYGAAYQLTSAPMQPMSGKMYTYFNTKWTFLIAFGIFELGSLLCGVAQSSVMLIIGRAVAGFGVAGLQNGCLTILAGLAPLARRAFLTSIIMGVAQLGIVAGPLLGGAFTEYATWRWCFYVNLPIGGVVVLFIASIHIPEAAHKMKWSGLPEGQFKKQLRFVLVHRFDFPGFILFSGMTVELLLALQWGGSTYPWKSSTIIGLFVGAGVTAAVWLVWNIRRSNWKGNDEVDNKMGEAALVPTPIAKQRAVWASALTTMTLMGNVIITAFFIAIYFQAVRDATPVLGGVYMLPNILSQLFTAVFSGFLISRLGYYLPWAVAGASLTAVGSGLLSTLSPTSATGHWIGFQILAGAGRGMVFQAPFLAIQNVIKPSQISIAMGLLSFGQNLGGAVLLTVANTVFDNSLQSQLVAHAPQVSPEVVIEAGATGFRTVVPASVVPGVVLAYADSVDRVFYLAASLSALCFVFSWGLGWKDIRVTKKAAPAKVEGKV